MDKEDLYKKLTERGERTVGQANKGINVEKIIIGLKFFKLKFKKGEKKKKKPPQNCKSPI